MNNRTCKICKKEFIPNSNNQLYCSKICYKINFSIYMKNYIKKYYEENKTELLKKCKEYCNRPEIKKIKSENDKIYCALHRKEITTKHAQWVKKNKKNRTVYKSKYEKQRKLHDISYKILCNLRSRLNLAIKGYHKSTLKLLGCSIKVLRKHLQSKFQPGMSFSNYGKWHVDHIKPCASFDLSKPEEQLLCFHYTNLQPLWAIDNLRKGDKYEL